jgi:hypothetical protein
VLMTAPARASVLQVSSHLRQCHRQLCRRRLGVLSTACLLQGFLQTEISKIWQRSVRAQIANAKPSSLTLLISTSCTVKTSSPGFAETMSC